jgi:uncharacterized membrane protein SirB2
VFVEFARALQASALSIAIQSHTWLTPLLQSIHILMIGVVFVSVLMLCLRILGRVRTDESFDQVWRRFAPWMWSGLVVMTVTGVILIIGEPVREFTAMSFWLKMLLLAIAVATSVTFGRRFRPVARSADPSLEFSSGARSAAIVTVVVWLVIIFLGRAIAYDIEVWESWHLAANTIQELTWIC